MNYRERYLMTYIIYILILCCNLKLPIIIVPDFASTNIDARLNRSETPSYFCHKTHDWYKIWHNPLNCVFGADCFVDNFKLIYDEKINSMVNQIGVETRFSDLFGVCEQKTTFWEDMLFYRKSCRHIIELLKTLSYNESEIYTLNYDFRMVGDKRNMANMYKDLDQLVLVANNIFGPPIIISYGLGGLLTTHYLKYKTNRWKIRNLDSWYTINAPFGGSISASLTQFIYNDIFSPFYVGKTRLNNLLSTFPITLFLLPSIHVFNESDAFIILGNDSINAMNLRSFFSSIDTTGSSLILSFIPDVFVRNNPGIPTACVHTSNLMTTSSIEFPDGKWGSNFVANFMDGDGFSTQKSLSACLLWDKDRKNNFNYLEIENTKLLDPLSHPNLIKHLENFISTRQSYKRNENRLFDNSSLSSSLN